MKERTLEICTFIPASLEGLQFFSLSEPLLYFKLLSGRRRCCIKGTEVNNVIVTVIFLESNSSDQLVGIPTS